MSTKKADFVLVSRKIDVTRTIIQPFVRVTPVVPSCGTSLPRLGKIWDSLETNLERWCYLFGNLNNFAQKPTDPAGFDDVFDLARTGELDGEGLKQYVSTMLNEYEKYTYGEYARREGYKEGEAAGIEKGKEELVKQLLRMKVPIETIQQASGFTKEQIEAL